MAGHDLVLIFDFGSQYTQLIARRVREQNVYCEIVHGDCDAARVRARAPKGIILSGGPASVYQPGAPTMDAAVLSLGVPVLGICYGLQLSAHLLGLVVAPAASHAAGGEYGRREVRVANADGLFAGLPPAFTVWMSHGDQVADPGGEFEVLASTDTCPLAALRHRRLPLYGVQFHPEVTHTDGGREIVRNFLRGVCGAAGDWTPSSFVDDAVATIRARIGANHVVCALSGGVDSAVVAALIHRAAPRQLTCVFVDNGLLRKGEARQVEETFRGHFHMDLRVVDASRRFHERLAGVEDPEEKRIRIGHLFIEVFTEEARHIPDARFLAQGTLYPDVIESVAAHGGPTATIKRHHNVGGLPRTLRFELLEPLRFLFKDEVRAIGQALGLPDRIVWRHPFPGPGMAVRILGPVTPQRVALLQEADAVTLDEVWKSGLAREIWQAFTVLLPVRTVGVMGDGRTYDHVAALRFVTSTDGMTADWARVPHDLLARISARIINEVRGINRVVYDISSKPPATIEWE
ncbi:MAG: glutamine-hydrolyzing GMP synthase [Planctomycetes bacterium]|nr:glutamine-hydrolyzing GMP synthase [Planctomycetota bacterium]